MCQCPCSCTNALTITDRWGVCRQCVRGSHDPRQKAALRAADLTLVDDGVTLVRETLAPTRPARGYAVGITHGTGAVTDLDREHIAVAILDVWRRFPNASNIGTWVSDGTVCVDPVVIVSDRDAAYTLATQHQQQAIFDFATGSDILIAPELTESELRAMWGDK